MMLSKDVFKERIEVRAAGQAAQPLAECILDVTIPEQALTEWCWAAVAVGIAEAYGDGAETQCQVATRVRPCAECCPDGEDPDCCNQPNGLKRPLATHCGKIFTKPEHRIASFVRDRIDQGYPIAVRIDWRKKGSGHFVVIRGYREMPTPAGLEFHVCDPYVPSVAVTPIPFAHFLSYYDQRGFWHQSFETTGDRPVQKV